jgi:hypothetical protein
MKYLVLPVLLGLVLAGCTSSEPPDLVATAPAARTAVPAPAMPSFNAADAAASATSVGLQPGNAEPAATSASAPAISSAGFPPPPACGPDAECAAPARMEKCRTVGSVTTCDVPPDPSADSTRYTN